MKLDKLNYSDTDLVNVTVQLAAKLNVLQPLSLIERNKLDRKKNLFKVQLIHIDHWQIIIL